MNADKLIAFRQTAHECLGGADDVMFELGDAVLSCSSVNSFAQLSCSPLFRRQGSSLSEALQDSRPQQRKLMRLSIEQMKQTERPILAGDHTNRARPYAVTLQERTDEHQAAMLGNRAIGVGQGWSTLAWIAQGHCPCAMSVERLDQAGHRRTPKPVWLSWVGETMLPLDQIWPL